MNIENAKIKEFLAVTTREELAKVLRVHLKTLTYYLYICPDDKKYSVFNIRKKSGGVREICAPNAGLKMIQQRLLGILNELYPPKVCVHGYVKGQKRGIKSNAEVHKSKNVIVNVDLKDFFPSINFGRVRGLFKSHPFNFNDEMATVLAQLCCHRNALPQGAPTSPVLSNCVCRRLDDQLLRFCREQKVNYTRYADDLTFSTGLKEFPKEIGTVQKEGVVLSKGIVDIVYSNGFVINDAKTRFAKRNNRQEVTGLIVNRGVNVSRKFVRQVRAMLHAWEKFGLEDAAKEHFCKYNYKHRKSDFPSILFKNILIGKINFVGQIKGRENRIFLNLCKRLKELDASVKFSLPEDFDSRGDVPTVFCEGKTDGIHLKAALDYFNSQGLFKELEIKFFKYSKEHEINNADLLKICMTRNRIKQSSRLEIYLFDSDDNKCPKKDLCEQGRLYKNWGCNVYSMMLPKPPHRDFDEVCIEFFYSDEDLKIKDKDGRRIYTTDEFDPETGNLKGNSGIYYPSRGKLKNKYPKIIDTDVKQVKDDKNVAMSKYFFAKHISSRKAPYHNVSFEHFKPIFDLFEEIISASKKEVGR